jgi:D-hexose-6-phosphate mutarotase
MDIERRNNNNQNHRICWKPGHPIIYKMGPGSKEHQTFLCVVLLIKWLHIIVATLLCSAVIENILSTKKVKNDVW